MTAKTIKSFLMLFILLLFTATVGRAVEISGEVTLDNRFYPEKGLYGNSDQYEGLLIFKPEFSHSWDDDRKVLLFVPFLSVANPDEAKTQLDIREASYVAAYEKFELRAGISSVFWGVTESQHLVDIINQTDAVLNTDGEDKLGQPMLNVTYISDFGNVDLFILPYFRERTFSGEDGRFRGPLVIDTDNPLYEHKDEERHIDLASRYSHTFGDLDVGVSVFKGTDRRPLVVLNNEGTKLLPYYIQTTQYGIDLQYVYEAWLFKFEGIHKDSDLRSDYNASTFGFEYTFGNIKNSGLDIGVLLEHLYDDRLKTQSIFYNHTFIGTRVVLNDEKSTEVLAGIIVNNSEGNISSLRFEGSRRINQNWKWEIEANSVLDTQVGEQFDSFRDDDYVQLSLSYYF